MGNFQKMFSTQMILFVYVFIGIICGKKKIIDEHTEKKVSDFVLFVTLPCMIFGSFDENITSELLLSAVKILMVSLSMVFTAYLVGKIAYRWCLSEKQQILKYATLINNAAFLGMPVVESIYGNQGLVYTSIYLIPSRVFMWTAGIAIFEGKGHGVQETTKKILLNPGITVVFLGLVRRVLNVPLPEFLDMAIIQMGNATTPLSMMLIGTMISGVSMKALIDKPMCVLVGIRLFALPIMSLGVTAFLHADIVLRGCTLILTAMPAGSTAALLAAKYGADSAYASKCVFVTTVISMISIPFLVLLL